jgi:flagellar motor switch protein FliN/FliY
MSFTNHSEAAGLTALDAARQIFDKWMDGLAQVLESMTDQRPKVAWQPAGPPPTESAGETIWWEQPFSGLSDALVWVGASGETWEHTGTLTLKVAGLETVASNEARNTWIEILSQSLSVLARSLTSFVGSEVLCGEGGERPPAPDVQDWISVSLGFPETALPPLTVGFSRALSAFLAGASRREPGAANSPVVNDKGGEEQPVQRSRTMELLLEVELPVSISFGKTCLPLRDVLKLTTGSIVELNRTASDPVDVLVNRRLLARGEVVVVEGNYGVRIQQIASRQDRLRSLP